MSQNVKKEINFGYMIVAHIKSRFHTLSIKKTNKFFRKAVFDIFDIKMSNINMM